MSRYRTAVLLFLLALTAASAVVLAFRPMPALSVMVDVETSTVRFRIADVNEFSPEIRTKHLVAQSVQYIRSSGLQTQKSARSISFRARSSEALIFMQRT